MKKVFDSKGKTNKRKRTIIALFTLSFGSVFALSSATIAWFGLANNSGASVATFSGDLDVDIRKVSAYKYVYPYHKNSVEFVDYDGVGQVKSYVVEDSSIETPNNLANKVTFVLGKNTSQPYATTSSDPAKGPSKIHYENSRNFNYYLVGDSTFTGVSTDEWSTLSAYAFARKDAPVVGGPVTLENVIVSAGAELVLFDASSIVDTNCDYFTYNTPTTTPSGNARFTLVESNRLKCLKSGIYRFDYRVDDGGNYYLDITLTSRNDNAIIGSNLVDPTKITIDYRGSASATYVSLLDYLPHAIQEQKTMVVLDVELSYQNKNAIDASLTITRDALNANAPSIYGFTGKYNTTHEYTYRGYVDGSHRNPFNASDFYAFYVLIAKNANAYASPTAAWEALSNYCQTDYETVEGKRHAIPQANPYNKFANDSSFDRNLACDVLPKEIDDSTLIPGSNSDNLYHFYIAIDYDYEHMQFFTNQDRVGKTYLLDRDFQFYFGATEHIEEQEPVPSPLPYVGGEKD